MVFRVKRETHLVSGAFAFERGQNNRFRVIVQQGEHHRDVRGVLRGEENVDRLPAAKRGEAAAKHLDGGGVFRDIKDKVAFAFAVQGMILPFPGFPDLFFRQPKKRADLVRF